MTHAPESLLTAVGVDDYSHAELFDTQRVIAGNPDDQASIGLEYESFYTGPALDTPELDAILIVAGLKCLRESNVEVRFSAYEKLGPFWFVTQHPGHALAAAIAEVMA
jgi:hypothetical protein